MSAIAMISGMLGAPMAVHADFERVLAAALSVLVSGESGGENRDGGAGKSQDSETLRRVAGVLKGASRPLSVLPGSRMVVDAGGQSLYQRVNGVAVVDVWGPLMRSESDVVGAQGERYGTSYQGIRAAMFAAVADPEVLAIVQRMDSPGGDAMSVHQLGNEMYDLAQSESTGQSAQSGMRPAGKPIVAYSDPMMASAALGIGSQANALLVAPGAYTGSIGTMANYVSYSRLLDRIGIDVNAIKNPDHKDAGSPYRTMTGEDRSRLQSMIDTYAGKFRADVARGRRVSAETVDGWVKHMNFVGDQAVKAGLADGVANSIEMAVAMARRMAEVRKSRK